MQPNIDRTTFGSITIAGEVFARDVIIRLNGQVKKRAWLRILGNQIDTSASDFDQIWRLYAQKNF